MTVVINGTTGIDTGTGSLIAADATTPTYLDLFEDTDNGSNYVRLIAPTSIASNRTLTLPDGTGTFVVNGVNGSLVSGTAVTASGTSVEFTGIPSWAKRITLMFSGVSPSSTGTILIQLGDSGGYETSGYVGRAQRSGSSSTEEVALSSGFAINTAAGTAVVNGLAFICLLDSTTNTWAANATLGRSDAAAMQVFGGVKPLSATLDRLRLYIDGTQTFDAGTINILYE